MDNGGDDEYQHIFGDFNGQDEELEEAAWYLEQYAKDRMWRGILDLVMHIWKYYPSYFKNTIYVQPDQEA